MKNVEKIDSIIKELYMILLLYGRRFTEMTERQYLRANSSLYPILMTLYGVLLLMGIGIIFSSINLAGFMQIIGSIGCMIADTVIYMKKKNTKYCATALMATGAVMYIIIMLFNHRNEVYVYALPILCTSIIYLNVRYIIAGGTVTVLGIIIHTVKMILEDNFSPDITIISIVVTGLFIAGAYKVSRLLTAFNTENMAAQEKSGSTMVLVAENLIKHFEDAKDMLEDTKKSVNTCKDTMEEIASATGTTAEAIQQQAIMCSEIEHNTSQAEKKTEIMIESSVKTLKTVEEGAQIVGGLKEQAANVQEASKAAAKSSKELSTRVEEVRGIIGTILSISSQTNLLALNASIEAARAGDAGRGFAVVAEEIRQLSVQTQEATAKITDIINDLNMEVEKAVKSMEDSAESINKQTELIDVTQDKFELIDSEVKGLTDVIDQIESVVKAIISATETITDNISHLSATGEEIAASTTEGVKIADETHDITYELVKVIEAIYELAKDLKKYKHDI